MVLGSEPYTIFTFLPFAYLSGGYYKLLWDQVGMWFQFEQLNYHSSQSRWITVLIFLFPYLIIIMVLPLSLYYLSALVKLAYFRVYAVSIMKHNL